MDYPKYVIIDNEEYEINTDFRVAIKCNEIAEDGSIGDYERSLAIIYKLFGEKGLNATEHYSELIDYAKKFLTCNKEEIKIDKIKKPDMDFVEDMDYIEASFMSDYHIDLSNEKMHFWKFMKLLEGLSNSELGNCCILNKIRNLRSMDPKKIKNAKDRQELIEQQKRFALKKYEKKKEPTLKQRESAKELYKILGIERE